jgi:hypothetical protein
MSSTAASAATSPLNHLPATTRTFDTTVPHTGVVLAGWGNDVMARANGRTIIP